MKAYNMIRGKQPLSYKHLFHAGNHGDVLKHSMLTMLIGASLRNNKSGTVFVDTHSGPGGTYDLTSDTAARKNEHVKGVSRIYDLGRLASLNPHIQTKYETSLPTTPEDTQATLSTVQTAKRSAKVNNSVSQNSLYLRLFAPTSDLFAEIPTVDGYATPGVPPTAADTNIRFPSVQDSPESLDTFSLLNMPVSDALSNSTDRAHSLIPRASRLDKASKSRAVQRLAAYVRYHLPIPAPLLPYLASLCAANSGPGLSSLVELPDPENMNFNEHERYQTNPYKIKNFENRMKRREAEEEGSFHSASRADLLTKSSFMRAVSWLGINESLLPAHADPKPVYDVQTQMYLAKQEYVNSPSMNSLDRPFIPLHRDSHANIQISPVITSEPFFQATTNIHGSQIGTIRKKKDTSPDTTFDMQSRDIPIDEHTARSLGYLSKSYLKDEGELHAPSRKDLYQMKVDKYDRLRAQASHDNDRAHTNASRDTSYQNRNRQSTGGFQGNYKRDTNRSTSDGSHSRNSSQRSYQSENTRNSNPSRQYSNPERSHTDRSYSERSNNDRSSSRTSYNDRSSSRTSYNDHSSSRSSRDNYSPRERSDRDASPRRSSHPTDSFRRSFATFFSGLNKLLSGGRAFSTKNDSSSKSTNFKEEHKPSETKDSDGMDFGSFFRNKTQEIKRGKKTNSHFGLAPSRETSHESSPKPPRSQFKSSPVSQSTPKQNTTSVPARNNFDSPFATFEKNNPLEKVLSTYEDMSFVIPSSAPLERSHQPVRLSTKPTASVLAQTEAHAATVEDMFAHAFYGEKDLRDTVFATLPPSSLRTMFSMGSDGKIAFNPPSIRKLTKRERIEQERASKKAANAPQTFDRTFDRAAVSLAHPVSGNDFREAEIDSDASAVPQSASSQAALALYPNHGAAYVDTLLGPNFSGLSMRADEPLRWAPSSPYLLHTSLRPMQDRLFLTELHSTEYIKLVDNYSAPTLAGGFRLQDKLSQERREVLQRLMAIYGGADYAEAAQVSQALEQELEIENNAAELENDVMDFSNSLSLSSDPWREDSATTQRRKAQRAQRKQTMETLPPHILEKKVQAIIRERRNEVEKLRRGELDRLMNKNYSGGVALVRKDGFNFLERIAATMADERRHAYEMLRNLARSNAHAERTKDISIMSANDPSLNPELPLSPGLVLIDPAYEGAFEYAAALGTLRKTLDKWPEACISIWYPTLRDGVLVRSETGKFDEKTHKPLQKRDKTQDKRFNDASKINNAEDALDARLLNAFENEPRYKHRSIFLGLARRLINESAKKTESMRWKEIEAQKLARLTPEQVRSLGVAGIPVGRRAVVAELFTNNDGFTVGSGMLVVNPIEPEHFAWQLEESIPWLASALNENAFDGIEQLVLNNNPDGPSVGDFSLEWF